VDVGYIVKLGGKHTAFILRDEVDPEDGVGMFVRNLGTIRRSSNTKKWT
jgi:hypothetical protein